MIILDNANTCNSAVLDRLNSLLDDDKKIYLNESGENRIIQPNNKFKIFLTMNPLLGEVSRALKNRCVELYFNGYYIKPGDEKHNLQKFMASDRKDNYWGHDAYYHEYLGKSSKPKLAYDKELNKNQQSTEEFYHKLLSMIIMKNPIMYRKKDLREFMYFFDVDIKIENGVHVSLENNTPKTRKKIK